MKIGRESPFKSSINLILNQCPFDGCMIVFNAHHHSWRAEAAEIGLLRVNQFHRNRRGEGRGPEDCDIYVTWRE